MKKINLTLMLVVGLLIFNSCQQETVEEQLDQTTKAYAKPIPQEDEDVTQFINEDARFDKPEVTDELLQAVEDYRAAQSHEDYIESRAHCTEICEGLGGMPVFCEGFDDRNTGSVSDNSIYFERWNPNSANDAHIVNSWPEKILRVDHRVQTLGSLNEEDILLLLGEELHGCYSLRWDMYIGNCRTAFFDIQKTLRDEVLAGFVFEKFGEGVAITPDGDVPFSYPVGEWFEVEMHFNITRPFEPIPPATSITIPNMNTVEIVINGVSVATVTTTDLVFAYSGVNSGTNDIRGINFYPLYRSSKFYLDDFCLSFLGDPILGGD